MNIKPMANTMNKHILMMAHDGQCHNRENSKEYELEYNLTLNLARWRDIAVLAGISSFLYSGIVINYEGVKYAEKEVEHFSIMGHP